MPRLSSCPSLAQRGVSTLEFTLTAVPVLLAGLGTIELARWFFVKQAVSLALLEAARAGITQNARAQTIEAAFEHALLPLFPASGAQSASERLQHAFKQREESTAAPPWQIRVATPNTEAFKDFATAGLNVQGAEGLAVINNNYQAEQHQRYLAKGWLQGRGPASGATIFQANELTLNLTYMHEPLVPGVGALLRQLMSGSSGYEQQALAGGYLPMRQTLRLTMQSHPVAWPYTGPKVLGAHSPWPALPASATPSSACRGLWCQHPPASPSAQVTPPVPNSPAPPATDPTQPANTPQQPPNATSPTESPPATHTPLPEPDSSSCSVVCCG